MIDTLDSNVGVGPFDDAPSVFTGVLRAPGQHVERLALIEGGDPGTYLVALDLSRARNVRLIGGEVTLVHCGRSGSRCVPLEEQVRVRPPTATDLARHRELEARLFPSCRSVRPGRDLTVVRLEVV